MSKVEAKRNSIGDEVQKEGKKDKKKHKEEQYEEHKDSKGKNKKQNAEAMDIDNDEDYHNNPQHYHQNQNYYQHYYYNQNYGGKYRLLQEYSPQIVQQKQDEVLCTQGLGRLLNAAEDYAEKVKSTNSKKKYKAYDTYANNDGKTTERMKMELMTHINLFKMMYDEYKKSNGGKYKFPANLSKKQILEDLAILKSGLKSEDADIYDSIGALISDKKIKDYLEQIKEMEKGNPKAGQIDPYYAAKTAPKIRQTLDEMNEAIKDELHKKGDVDNSMVLGGEAGDYMKKYMSGKSK